MPFGKKDKDNIFSMGMGMDMDKIAEKEMKSGIPNAEKELEDLSFVKKTGRKDRDKNDVFAKLGL